MRGPVCAPWRRSSAGRCARLHPQPPRSASYVRTLDVRLTSVRFLGNQVRAC